MTQPGTPIKRQLTQFAAVLEDAQKQYAELRSEEMADFMNPPMKSVQEMLAVINRQNDEFGNFRKRRGKLFHAMSVALVPLEVVGESLAGAASEVFAPSQNIFAAVMYLVNSARDVSACYDNIEELFEKLKDFTARLSFYVSQRMSKELHEKVVNILVTLFQILILATAEIRQGRAMSYIKRLLGKESPVNEPMKRLAHLTESEGRLVGAETLAVVKQSLSNEERLIQMMSRVDINVQTLRTQTREVALSSNRDKLKGILRPSVYPRDTYDVLDRTRTQGTCEWVLKDPFLKQWLVGQVRFLWVTGNPGTGKSYLTARMVRLGLGLIEDQDAAANMMGYFFFKQTNPETRSVRQALRDIAYQVSEQDVFYGKQLLQLLSSSDDIKTVTSAFRRLLVDPCRPDKWRRHIYIVLDGIDEADPTELKDFLTLLDALNEQSSEGTRVQVALIGRNSMSETVLQQLQNDSTGGEQFRTLHVTAERNGQDVVSYIADGVNKTRVLQGTPQSFRNEIIDIMTKQVDGLFILAKFMLNAISTERHARGIKEKLQSYPKEVNGMLKQTVLGFSQTITKTDADDLNEILRWVSCAEKTLTLEQIESILALRYGDTPLRLEGQLRTQLAAFFTLEREDGLSTAELVERHQLQKQMMAEARDTSPTRRSPIPDGEGEVEYYSNKRTTAVTFFHASVSEFFRDECSTNLQSGPDRPAIGFDFGAAKLHVLLTCLRIFTEPNCFAFGAQGISLQKYASWYWQEHLEHLDKAAVSPQDKAEVGKLLYTMLTDRPILLQWANLFEESLDLWTDKNIDAVRAWLADPEVIRDLPEDAKLWAQKAASSSVELLKPMGRIFAQAWLKEDFGMYMPTLFCFGVVQTLALMETGEKWSDSEYHWGDVPLETRVNMATKWANQPETGHWYRRTGSTLLELDLHQEALRRFQEALRLDGNIVETCGRIGRCYYKAGQYREALNGHLMSNAIDERNLQEKSYRTAREISYAKWRVYKNLYSIAECYRKLDRVTSAITYCRKAINNAYDAPHFEPEALLMRVLAENNRVTEIQDLLRELDNQYNEEGRCKLISFLLDQIPSDATRDWIPDAAARTNKTDVCARRYQAAIALAQDAQNSRKEYYLRNALGRVYMAAEEYDRAILIQEAICYQDYKPRGSIAVRVEYASSFRNLACLYYLKALQADPTLRSEATDPWVAKLEELKRQQSKYENRDVPLDMAGFDVNEASIFLVLFYRFKGKTEQAMELASKLVLEGIAILEDEEPQNDQIGVRNLQRALVAAGDIGNALALWQSTRKPTTTNLSSSGRRKLAERRVSSPRGGASPKRAPHEVNLTQVFSEDGEFAPALACDYCLKRFEVTEEYAVCVYCIDTLFCLHCLENVIKLRSFSPGHTSACGPNHSWMFVPPLYRDLSPGEIVVDGEVTRLDGWKANLKTVYQNPRLSNQEASPNVGLGIM